MPGGKPRPKKKRAARRDPEDTNEGGGGRRYYPDEDRGFYQEPVQPLTEEEKAERARQREYDEVEQVRPGEPLIQRWWRLRREGHDPGIHPQAVVTDSTDSIAERAMEWFRRAPVMGTLILGFGTLVIVVPIVIISLDEESDEVADFEFIEDEDSDAAETDTAETDTAETEPADPPAEEAPPPAPAEEPDEPGSASVMPGIRIIEGTMGTQCGGDYTANLRSTRFNNGEEITEQTITLGGNALQTASGWGNNFISIMTWTEADFYEVWFFIWNVGDITSIFNIYGTSAAFVPPTSVADTARFNDIASLSDLTAAIGPSDDSCGGELAIAGVQTNDFPEVG